MRLLPSPGFGGCIVGIVGGRAVVVGIIGERVGGGEVGGSIFDGGVGARVGGSGGGGVGGNIFGGKVVWGDEDGTGKVGGTVVVLGQNIKIQLCFDVLFNLNSPTAEKKKKA